VPVRVSTDEQECFHGGCAHASATSGAASLEQRHMIAAHLRVHDEFVIQTIVPIMIWIGFGLRHVDEMRSS
jgi:hypothetical protein